MYLFYVGLGATASCTASPLIPSGFPVFQHHSVCVCGAWQGPVSWLEIHHISLPLMFITFFTVSDRGFGQHNDLQSLVILVTILSASVSQELTLSLFCMT